MINFSQELFDEICRQTANGKFLLRIVRDDGMPSRLTVYRWHSLIFENTQQYARDTKCEAIAKRLRDTERGKSVDETNDNELDKLIINTDLRLLRSWTPSVDSTEKEL